MLIASVVGLVALRMAGSPSPQAQPGGGPAPSSTTASAQVRDGSVYPAFLAQAVSTPDRAPGEHAPAIGTPMGHGGVARTHRAVGLGPQTSALRWKTDVGAAVVAQVVTSRDEAHLYAATLGGRVVSLAAANGQIEWSIDLGDRVYTAPAVDAKGRIYVGCDNKKLVALGPDGTVAWKFETAGEADTAPLVLDDGVVFAAGKELLSLSGAGDLRFRFKTQGKIFSAPAQLANGTLVVGAQDNDVVGIDVLGKLVFRTHLGSDVDGSPVASDDGTFYVGTDAGEVVKLDSRGAIVWRSKLGGYVRGGLSLSRNGDVLVGHYGPAPRVVRVRKTDGMVVAALVIAGTGTKEFGVHGGPLEDEEGALYFGAQDDQVTALGPGDVLRFRFDAGGDVDAPLTILGGRRLVVASESGTVFLLGPGGDGG